MKPRRHEGRVQLPAGEQYWSSVNGDRLHLFRDDLREPRSWCGKQIVERISRPRADQQPCRVCARNRLVGPPWGHRAGT